MTSPITRLLARDPAIAVSVIHFCICHTLRLVSEAKRLKIPQYRTISTLSLHPKTNSPSATTPSLSSTREIRLQSPKPVIQPKSITPPIALESMSHLLHALVSDSDRRRPLHSHCSQMPESPTAGFMPGSSHTRQIHASQNGNTAAASNLSKPKRQKKEIPTTRQNPPPDSTALSQKRKK